MEIKKFTTEAQEVAYLKQWLSHDFAQDDEHRTKKARYEQLYRKYSETDLKPFMKELGRARAGVLQHIFREIFSIPQRKLIDQEIYRRMEGRTTLDFKYLLVAPVSDDIIQAAKSLAEKTTLMLENGSGKRENYSDKLKGEILALVRLNSPQALVKDILSGKVNDNGRLVVPVEHILKVCKELHPELSINQ